MTAKQELSPKQEISEKITKRINSDTKSNIDKDSFSLKRPARAVIYSTIKCNFSCKHCYTSNYPKFKELDINDYDKIFKKLMRTGVMEIIFLGGEPLFRKDFFEIAKNAKKYGFGIKVSSNGSVINDENIDKIKELFDGAIQISLDGVSEKNNDKIRGNGSFKRTINSLEKLSNKNIDFSIGYVINKINKTDILKAYDLAKKIKASGIHYIRIMPKGRALENWNNLKINNEEYKEIIKDIRNHNDNSISLQIDGTYEYKNNIPLIGKYMQGCEAGRYEITIMPGGSIVPCDMFENKILGNILKDDLIKIWKNNKILNKFRNCKEKLEDRCKNCEIDYCVGCRYQALALTNNFYANDPFCIK